VISIERDWRGDERAKWNAMTDDERFDMHMTVRENRANFRLAADRLEHQLEGAVDALTEIARRESYSRGDCPDTARVALERLGIDPPTGGQ
jgi:hypothetical protein